jgi:hypothetical protein
VAGLSLGSLGKAAGAGVWARVDRMSRAAVASSSSFSSDFSSFFCGGCGGDGSGKLSDETRIRQLATTA